MRGIWMLLFVSLASSVHAEDWPQWMGPKRDDVWRETGIVAEFPKAGPKKLWSAPIFGGYSGPSVAGGKVFVTDYETSGNTVGDPGLREVIQGVERVRCLSAADGKQLWEHKYEQPYNISYPVGPRATPTVEGDRVYALGAMGRLTCLAVKTGRLVWESDFTKQFKTKPPFWGYAGHPLVDGDTLYCIVGGEGSVAVAFDKLTGKVKWQSVSAREQGYSCPTIIKHGGVRQLIVWDAEVINSLNLKDGSTYWSIPIAPDYGMSIMAPQLSGDFLFAAGIVGKGALLKLTTDDGKPAAEVVYQVNAKTALSPVNSAPLIDGATMYGVDREGQLRGITLATGERLWETFKATTEDGRKNSGTAFLTKHADRYFLFNERGDLIIAQLSPAGYSEVSRAHLIEPTSTAMGRPVVWSHPAYAQKCVFVRNDKELACFSLAE